MHTLRNVQKQIPGGYFFRQPEIKWDSKKVLGLHPSLEVLANAVISARKANPHYVQQHNWSLDRATVLEEVKAFNVKVCLSMGWMSYLTDIGGGAPPFSKAQSLLNQKQTVAVVGSIKRIWAGVKTLNDWLDSEEPPIPIEQAEKRAAVCVNCNLNGKGDWTSQFTKPAAGAIMRQLQRLQDRKITSSQDANLQVCEACLCPLKLKVHTPMKYIKPHLADDVIAELKKGKDCWIIAELAA